MIHRKTYSHCPISHQSLPLRIPWEEHKINKMEKKMEHIYINVHSSIRTQICVLYFIDVLLSSTNQVFGMFFLN